MPNSRTLPAVGVLGAAIAGLLGLFSVVVAAEPHGPVPFLNAKTVFQTNLPFDPRLAIAVDAVIVHRHGDDLATLRKAIGSWKQRGWPVGRMFFADSDAANAYWSGKWDGTPRLDEVERNATGEVMRCAGIRPYMLPTEGWIRYCEEQVRLSVEAGADAILPEEPLAHVFTGYEKAFHELWARRYGRPWEPESASAEARFLTAQLKSELYLELERRLAEVTAEHGRRLNRRIPFIMPVHGLYSNIASHLVAPLGTSIETPMIDGYIGQVWTGPVNWALANYDSPEKSFFDSAHVLYDYFAQLVAGGNRRMWLLVDPVEDDPRHTWEEFEIWYRRCVTAMLLCPGTVMYEVMPWPDRIFLPGFETGGKTPAPERFRILTLSATQVLQDVPEGSRWCATPSPGPTEGVGVAVADSAMYERRQPPKLQDLYGQFVPLVHGGVPVAACLMERCGDARYLARFRVIVLSHESFKPTDAKMHAALAAWVKRGGSLILLGAADDLGGAPMWWRTAGFDSPMHHLLAELGVGSREDGDWTVGKGWVARRSISPRRFGDPAVAREQYLPLVEAGLRKAGLPGGLAAPGYFCMRRGPFVIAQATRSPLTVPGRLIDVWDPELPVLDGVRLEAGHGGVYRDVTAVLDAAGGDPLPRVLHCTHRLMSEERTGGVLRFEIRGPAETPAVVRVRLGGRPVRQVAGRTKDGREVAVDSRSDGPTVRLRFPNHPEGVRVEITH